MYSTNFIGQERWVMEPKLWNNKTFIAIFFILLFHINGFFGIAFSPYMKWFISYTPLNLLVAMAAIVWVQKDKNKEFWYFLAGSCVAGWFIEFIGVNTSLPFGDYHYHGSLGWRVADIPLMTGVIWWLTCMGASAIANEVTESTNSRIVLSALLMVLFDIPVEHITGKMEMWHWALGYAPIQNYVGWLIYGAIMQYFLQKTNFQKKNKVAVVYFIAAFIFFLGLDLLEW